MRVPPRNARVVNEVILKIVTRRQTSEQIVSFDSPRLLAANPHASRDLAFHAGLQPAAGWRSILVCGRR